MSETEEPEQATELVLDYELDAPPEKVWRALSIPAFREQWLPEEVEALSTVPGQEVRYRMIEAEPPFTESIVTFRLVPHEAGTILRIFHRLTDARAGARAMPANCNRPPLLRAA